MKDQDLLQEIKNELVQFNENIGGVRTDIKNLSRETVQRMDDMPNLQGSLDDIAEAQKQNTEVQQKLKEAKEKADESNKKQEVEEREKDNNRLLMEISESTKETREIQASTGDYLKQLQQLTEQNNKLAKLQYDGKKNDQDSLGMAFGNATLNALDKFGKKVQKSAKGPNTDVKGIFSGAGGMISGSASLAKSIIKGTKVTKDFVGGGASSMLRQRTIKKQKDQLDAQKAMYSAKRAELEKLKSGGGSKEDIKDKLKDILELKAATRETASKLGENVASESFFQKSRSSKAFRKMSKEDKESVKSQMSENFYSSATEDLSLKAKLAKDAKKKEEVKGTGGGSFKEALGAVIPRVKKPTTLGGYIYGIYNELTELNENVNRGFGKKGKESKPSDDGNNGGGGGGGFLSGMGLVKTALKAIPFIAAAGGGWWLKDKIQETVGGDGAGGEDLADDATIKGTKTALNVGADKLKKIGAGETLKNIPKNVQSAMAEKATKTGTKVLTKEGVKQGTKAGLKTAAKAGAKTLGKYIPGVGIGIGTSLAADRIGKGEYVAGGIEFLSGLASTIPKVGTLVSLALDAGLMGYDYLKDDSDEKSAGPNTISTNLVNMDRDKSAGPNTISTNRVVMDRDKYKIPLQSASVSEDNGLLEVEKMELQAKYNADAMLKMQGTPEYNALQRSQAKTQGTISAEVLNAVG